ncbi:Variant surface glycoprotein [Trypanosoma congolense IL3000]|uniref:Variant surface glycoprotein n=1 Tax=Trypanosoma congolense (strain IL3000) TaxID=1068625 RepID=F9WG39_TRYCI|nr:Variant surface glycoprotein [Trypanosoma congolense IL3000]
MVLFDREISLDRRIMTMIKFCVVMLVIMMSGGIATASDNHNGDKHEALCNVLGAAVSIFQNGRGGMELRRALRSAIFGSETSADISTLLAGLPVTHHNPGSRKNWCGTCTHSDSDHYPGKSIPHDLLCLCTIGTNGYPVVSDGSARQLCGRSAMDLGCGGGAAHQCNAGNGAGWSESNSGGNAKEYVEATWKTVVQTCLQKGLKLNLEQARKTLTEQLKPKDGTSPIWARGHSYGCKGEKEDICVNYDSWCDTKEYPQWLKPLKLALETADFANIEVAAAQATTGTTNGNATQVSRVRRGTDTASQITHHSQTAHQQHKTTDTDPISNLFENEDRSIPQHTLWLLFGIFLH